MAIHSDKWMKEFDEASKLADGISGIISNMGSLPSSPPGIGQNLAPIRRKKTSLVTRLDRLDSLLSDFPTKSEELQRRQEMLSNLRSKAEQMESFFSMASLDKREDLVWQTKGSEDKVDRIASMDNKGILNLQKQIMKEQDEGIDQLEESILSTRHLALSVNEELDLHAKLIERLDQDVDATDSRIEQAQKRLRIVTKRLGGSSSCKCLLISVIAVVILTAVMWDLIKYL